MSLVTTQHMNPFTSAPRLPSPVKRHTGSMNKTKRLSLHARTASRSPIRPRDVDSLLRDLSPTTTLRAFRAHHHTDSAEMAFESANADVLARSIESSSESERALGAKAAQSCLDLRTWMREMEHWTWPGSFDVPEHVRNGKRIEDGLWSGEAGEEYWGSLPATTVQAYEQRADEIGQLLDEMDVEELKDYVLSSHYRVNSRSPSRSRRLSTMSTLDMVTSDMKRLDDFTALVTATILQALPFLSHLNRLLDVWTIRLIILRSAPKYLRELHRARAELDQAWTTISASTTDGAAQLDRQTVLHFKSSFEHQMGTLGRKLDRFLDDLEGREDSVPDSWIDDFEHLESAFGAWVAHADRKVLEIEWHQSRTAQSGPMSAENDKQLAELEVPHGHAARHQSTDTFVSNDPFVNFDQSSSVIQRSVSPSVDAVATPAMHLNKLPSQSSDLRSVSERLTLNVEQPSSHRSVSDSAAQEEESGGVSISKRRAAFLNDIERTNSLKLASKSPVRPFEHASNAFTRLFKRDRSPEKARPVPKRSGSSRSALNDQLNNVIAAHRGSPARDILAQPPQMEQSRSHSLAEASGSLTTDARPDSPEHSTFSGTTLTDIAPAAQVYEMQEATGSGHSGPETYKPRRLSAPFDLPVKSQSEDCPLGGPSEAKTIQRQPQQHQTDNVLVPSFEEPSNRAGEEALRHSKVITNNFLIDRNTAIDLDSSSPAAADTHAETAAPIAPLQTDAFDRMFVETLPQAPTETPGSVNAPENSPPWTGSRRRHSLPRPQRANTPGLLRRSSVSSSYLDHEKSGPSAPPLESSPSTSFMSVKGEVSEAHEHRWAQRASATFIEAFPRSELKSINVSRPSGSSPPRSVSGSQTSPPRFSPDRKLQTQSQQAIDCVMASNTSRTIKQGDLATSSARSTESDSATMREAAPSSSLHEPNPALLDEFDSTLRAAPLNAAMTKRRGVSTVNDENKAPTYTLSPASPSKKATQSRHGEDSFDRHVSDVVSTLPAPIKFRSRPGAETPVHQSHAGESRASISPRLKNPPNARASSRAGMMIAPAESSPKKLNAALDSEVKLYHLTQAGRDEPIKLFVRLVGEGERVMVRVGGGWADLADYLRQYAEHHGSRTVSDGGLEMQTAPNGHSRRVSGPVELKARPSPATPVLGSGRTTPFRPQSRGSENDWSQQRPGSSGLIDATNASPFASRAPTPTLHGTTTRSSTPKSSSGSSDSRPSTANGAGSSRPSSRQSTPADSYGLAGPSSTGKRGMLSDHKAKWVDSMIERAKASAEKSKESAAREKYFGDLGKAGGTRRLVFRSGSGSGGLEKK